MKRIGFTVMLAVLFLYVEAQQSGFGPHGGRLKRTGNYQIELFGCDNYLEVYLFDRDTNAINNNDIKGTVVFYYSGEASLSSTLIRYGMDGFTAKIPTDTFLYCKPSFDIKGEYIISDKFENECIKRD